MIGAAPNPVVIHLYSDPIVWAVVAISLVGELEVATRMLCRRGQPREVLQVLFGIHVVSWPTFLVLLERWGDAEGLGWQLPTLELGVVVAEAAALWLALRSGVLARRLRTRPIGMGTGLYVSLIGNLVSFAISVAVPGLVWLLFRWLH